MKTFYKIDSTGYPDTITAEVPPAGYSEYTTETLEDGIIVYFPDELNTAVKNIELNFNIQKKAEEFKKFLNSTDWYYARKMEIGKEVPADVVAKRIEAREYLNLGVANE